MGYGNLCLRELDLRFNKLHYSETVNFKQINNVNVTAMTTGDTNIAKANNNIMCKTQIYIILFQYTKQE